MLIYTRSEMHIGMTNVRKATMIDINVSKDEEGWKLESNHDINERLVHFMVKI